MQEVQFSCKNLSQNNSQKNDSQENRESRSVDNGAPHQKRICQPKLERTKSYTQQCTNQQLQNLISHLFMPSIVTYSNFKNISGCYLSCKTHSSNSRSKSLESNTRDKVVVLSRIRICDNPCMCLFYLPPPGTCSNGTKIST